MEQFTQAVAELLVVRHDAMVATAAVSLDRSSPTDAALQIAIRANLSGALRARPDRSVDLASLKRGVVCATLSAK